MIFDEPTLNRLCKHTSPTRAALLRKLNAGKFIRSDELLDCVEHLSKVENLTETGRRTMLNVQLCRLRAELGKVFDIETTTVRRLVRK